MNNPERKARYSHWEALIEEQVQSGLTRKEFCQQKNLVVSQFTYYFTHLKTKKIKKNMSSPLVAPVYLKNQDPILLKGEIKIILTNGFNLNLFYENELQLKNIVEVLKSC
jgi:hypothetical protein